MSVRVFTFASFASVCIGWSAQVVFAQACPGSLPSGMDCVAASQTKDITAHSICSKVTNSHASGKAIMVSAATATEWSSFRASAPTGVSLSSCADMLMSVAHESSPFMTTYNLSDWSKLANPASLPSGSGRGIAYSAFGLTAVTDDMGPNYLSVYNSSSWTKVPGVSATSFGYDLAFHPNGSLLAMTLNSSPYIALYSTSNWAKLANPGTLPAGSGNGVAFSHDGSLLAIGHATSPFVTIYNSGSWTKLANPATLPPQTANGVAFNHDSSLLAVTHGGSPFVTIYNTSDWSKVANPSVLPTGTGYAVAFNPSGSLMAVAHDTSPFITIYNTSDWSKVANPATLPTGTGRGIAFNENGNLLTVAHLTSPYVTTYNTSDWSKVANPPTLPTGTAYDVAFSRTTPSDPCLGKSIGQTCNATTALYAGQLGTHSYMITPSGCTDSTTPTCAGGTDTVTKRWEGGSGALRGGDIAGITNISTFSVPSPVSETGDIVTPLITNYANVQAGSAAGFCENMSYGGYTDWYLPSKTEMAHIYCKSAPTGTHDVTVPDEDVNCTKAGGKSSELTGWISGDYWASTEWDSSNAWVQRFIDGNQTYALKDQSRPVRCIRKYLSSTALNCNSIDASWTPRHANVVSHWKLDGTIGAIANGATITATVGGNGTATSGGSLAYSTGKMNSAVDFSGVTDHIDFSTTSGANNLSAATWAGWVKLDFTGTPGTIIYKSDGNSDEGWWIDYGTGYGKLGLGVVHSVGNLRKYTNAIPTDGTWFHLAITWGGGPEAGSVIIYINGRPVDTYSHSEGGSGAHNPDAAQPLWLGKPGGGTSGNLRGEVDDFAIWNVALSANEVLSLYNGQGSCP